MYCTRCGTKNEDDAVFCKKCGNNLQGTTTGPGAQPGPPPRSREEDECERDCHGSDRQNAAWWGIIVIIIGAWVIWEFALKDAVDAPDWLTDDFFCTVIWIMVGIAIVAAGIRMLARRGQGR